MGDLWGTRSDAGEGDIPPGEPTPPTREYIAALSDREKYALALRLHQLRLDDEEAWAIKTDMGQCRPRLFEEHPADRRAPVAPKDPKRLRFFFQAMMVAHLFGFPWIFFVETNRYLALVWFAVGWIPWTWAAMKIGD